MNFFSFFKRDPSPKNLLLLFSGVAIFSIITILSLASAGIHHVYSKRVISTAEEDAVSMAKALLAMERQHFIQPGDEGLMVGIDKNELDYVDHRWRQLLFPFEIVKIKIYDNSCRIIYSTEHSIIGELDTENRRLLKALGGHNDSHLVTKDQMVDLASENNFDIDVVETYVPIRLDDGAVVGAFEIYRDVTRYRNEVSQALFMTLAILTSILLFVFAGSFVIIKIGMDQLARAQSALKELSSRDSLTGMLNRRETLEQAQNELSRILRHQDLIVDSCLAVLMVDIDFFKSVNDSYGHFAGDLVIKEVSRRLKETIRSYDILGRFGGEEFLIFLPETSFKSSLKVAEKVRQAIADKPFEINGAKRGITVSIGVSTTALHEKDLDEALKRADEGLYLAKNAGRNRVSWVQNDKEVQPLLFEVPSEHLQSSA